MIGMCHGKRIRTLSQVLAVQVRHPVFGNEVVHMGPGGDNTCALPQRPRTCFPLTGGRGHGDDRSSAFGERGPAHEIQLTANTRILERANAIRTDLAREVDSIALLMATTLGF